MNATAKMEQPPNWALVDFDAPVLDVGSVYFPEFPERVLMTHSCSTRSEFGRQNSFIDAMNWAFERPLCETLVFNTGAGDSFFWEMQEFWMLGKETKRRIVLCWTFDQSQGSMERLADRMADLNERVDHWIAMANFRDRPALSVFDHSPLRIEDMNSVRRLLGCIDKQNVTEALFPALPDRTALALTQLGVRSEKLIALRAPLVANEATFSMDDVERLRLFRSKTDAMWRRMEIEPGDCVIVCGGKGGTGKSTVSRSLVDYCIARSNVRSEDPMTSERKELT